MSKGGKKVYYKKFDYIETQNFVWLQETSHTQKMCCHTFVHCVCNLLHSGDLFYWFTKAFSTL